MSEEESKNETNKQVDLEDVIKRNSQRFVVVKVTCENHNKQSL